MKKKPNYAFYINILFYYSVVLCNIMLPYEIYQLQDNI